MSVDVGADEGTPVGNRAAIALQAHGGKPKSRSREIVPPATAPGSAHAGQVTGSWRACPSRTFLTGFSGRGDLIADPRAGVRTSWTRRANHRHCGLRGDGNLGFEKKPPVELGLVWHRFKDRKLNPGYLGTDFRQNRKQKQHDQDLDPVNNALSINVHDPLRYLPLLSRARLMARGCGQAIGQRIEQGPCVVVRPGPNLASDCRRSDDLISTESECLTLGIDIARR
jgi:hypothetical protein